MKDLYNLGNNIKANRDQELALDKMVNFIHSNDEEFTLVGKAGAGKTTIIKKIVEYYSSYTYNNSFFAGDDVVAATISHAAKNILRRALGALNVDTVTVASLLGMKQEISPEGEVEFLPQPKTWKMFPPPIKRAKLLIIDECSMISKQLLSLIREHKLKGTKIIFLGDHHQLPPIDTHREQDEDSTTFYLSNQARLNQRMRQKEESPIIALSDIFADNIDSYNETGQLIQRPLLVNYRHDNYNPITNEGIIFPKTIEEMFRLMLKDYKYAYENDKPNHVRAIAFRNFDKFGNAPYNITSINNTVRKHLWKTTDKFVINETIIANNQFTQGREMVLQNGDTMLVKGITNTTYAGVKCLMLNVLKSDKTMLYNLPVVSKEGFEGYKKLLTGLIKNAKTNYKLWRNVYAFKDQFADVGYGYAITSHKAQGSGYTNVYIFEDDIMDVQKTTYKEKNQCMYTAITRSIEKCVIFSELNKKAEL